MLDHRIPHLRTSCSTLVQPHLLVDIPGLQWVNKQLIVGRYISSMLTMQICGLLGHYNKITCFSSHKAMRKHAGGRLSVCLL